MSEYEDLFSGDEDAESSDVKSAGTKGEIPLSQTTPAIGAPAICSRWMFHRAGVYCHVCRKFGEKERKGITLHLDLPPGGKAKSDWKKGKEKKR